MSIYAASSLGTTNNKIDFNGTDFPIFRVQSRRPQQRQIRDLDIPVPFEMGVSDFETLIGKSAYVIEGTMYPGGEAQYDEGLRKLRKIASLELSQEDALSDDGYVPYVYGELNDTKQIFMKVLYVDLPETTRKGLVQPFRFVCKIKDPTIYGTAIKVADTREAVLGTETGSAIHPFQYPIVYGATTASVSTDAVNDGDLSVYPLGINIFGPVNKPKITNTTTGEYIEIDVNLASVSNHLTIQYDKDSLIVDLDGVSVIKKITSGSSYFKIRPESNVFELTGTSISDGSYATVSFYDGFSLG